MYVLHFIFTDKRTSNVNHNVPNIFSFERERERERFITSDIVVTK